MKIHSIIAGTLSIVLAFPCCGKRPKNFFSFEQKEEKAISTRMSLPAVRNMCYIKNAPHNKLVWDAITSPNLIGYNVYCFLPTAFIPKKPANSAPLKNPFFLLRNGDEDTQKEEYSIVRGVFNIDGKTQEGPSSHLYKIF